MRGDAPLRIAVFRESHFWLAQVLEHDVGVQAENLKDLVCRLVAVLEIEGTNVSKLPPAPKYFQDLWPLKSGLFVPDEPAPGLELGLVA